MRDAPGLLVMVVALAAMLAVLAWALLPYLQDALTITSRVGA